VLLEQSHPAATVFSRAADDWAGHIVSGETDLALPEIETTLPLTDLHEGVRFAPAPDEMQARLTRRFTDAYLGAYWLLMVLDRYLRCGSTSGLGQHPESAKRNGPNRSTNTSSRDREGLPARMLR